MGKREAVSDEIMYEQKIQVKIVYIEKVEFN